MYRAKRRFSVTSEPAPEALPRKKRSSGRPSFVVHKHDASRLHYDLRLEMRGALVSWAVPKGPSYDPAERRLAVQTEDHPLAYGEFEGRIPDGEYGGGDSLLWDRGTWRTDPPGRDEAMMEKGHVVFVLEGEKLRGRWHLIRTRGRGPKSQWLLFKGKDEHATKDYDVIAERPESVVSGRRVTRGPVRKKTLAAPHPDPIEILMKVWPPMFASLVSEKGVEGMPAVSEVKYDGYRALAAISGGRISLQSRNALDLAASFPKVVRGLKKIVAAEVVLDGEIIALDDGGNGRFKLLQRGEGELRYAVFDVLWLDGEDLRSRPLEERRDLLESLLANVDPPVVLAERLPEDLGDAMAEVRRRGLEGLIAKRKGSPYRSGVRGADWSKVKVLLVQELAVVGFTPPTGGRPAVGALHLGFRDGGKWRYAGKVGTGFTDATRRDLWRDLAKDVTSERPEGAPRIRDTRWVTPRFVVQVAFQEWTDDGKIRHPRFQGLRSDKRVEEVVRETPAGERARSSKPAWRTRWSSSDSVPSET